ncbi:MAG: hypothetical protein OXC44_07420 [Proteobacteria bacterium]|nr:hypothetical protein [Pseudomonadota bacterium]
MNITSPPKHISSPSGHNALAAKTRINGAVAATMPTKDKHEERLMKLKAAIEDHSYTINYPELAALILADLQNPQALKQAEKYILIPKRSSQDLSQNVSKHVSKHVSKQKNQGRSQKRATTSQHLNSSQHSSHRHNFTKAPSLRSSA